MHLTFCSISLFLFSSSFSLLPFFSSFSSSFFFAFSSSFFSSLFSPFFSSFFLSFPIPSLLPSPTLMSFALIAHSIKREKSKSFFSDGSIGPIYDNSGP